MTVWNAKTNRKAAKSRKAFRHHKPDRAATAERNFLDQRSFVNLDGDFILYGQDMIVKHDTVFARDKFRCVHCGATKELQVHHRQARGKNGSDNAENLETICAPCHAKFHVRTLWGNNGNSAKLE